MKIAMPIYRNYISNVFDFAHQLLLIDVVEAKENSRTSIELVGQSLYQRAVLLKKMQVDVLICGAISQELRSMILSFEIEVLPFVSGNIDDILAAYFLGELMVQNVKLPACSVNTGSRRGLRGKGYCRRRGI
jgi:predicted Fe-Mo cluster-binding NifX family protein